MKFIEEKQRVALKKGLKNFGKVEGTFRDDGPVLGRELVKTVTALVLAALLIFAYIAWQFKLVRN